MRIARLGTGMAALVLGGVVMGAGLSLEGRAAPPPTPLTLDADVGNGNDKYVEVQSSQVPGDPDRKETVITDRVQNNLVESGFEFTWPAEGAVFRSSIPPATRTGGKLTPAVRAQRWNTFRPVPAGQAAVGQVDVTPTPKVPVFAFTGPRWVVRGQAAEVVKLGTLYGRLSDGDDKGTVLLACESSRAETAGGAYEYTYRVDNRTGESVRFSWAGFDGDLGPGKSFRRTFESRDLTAETTGTARFVSRDGIQHALTANYWRRPSP